MTAEKHPHGTAARYCHGPAGDGVDPCREKCCRTAVLEQRARRRRSTPAHVDADPVRAHLLDLRSGGLSINRIARRAGVHYRTIANVLYGQPCANRPPPAKVRRATAHKLLAVPVPPRNVAWLRPSDRTVGYLRVLVARGWSVHILADRLNLDHSHVHKLVRGDKPTVTAATELAAITLHKQLWRERPPQGTRHEKAAVTRAQQYAATHGWALPSRTGVAS